MVYLIYNLPKAPSINFYLVDVLNELENVPTRLYKI